MKLLLDTCALLWWIFDDSGITSHARALIADPDNLVLVSAASGWEIATKYRIGKLPEAGDAVRNLPQYLRKCHFTVLPVEMEHALKAGMLPGPHRDPFDRMIICQALMENALVVTTDPVFKEYGVRVVA